MIATCRTLDCGNADIGLDLTGLLDDVPPELRHIVCGVCSEPITDVIGPDDLTRR